MNAYLALSVKVEMIYTGVIENLYRRLIIMNKDLELSDELQDLWTQLREHCEEVLEYSDLIDEAIEEYTLSADIDQLQRTIEIFNRKWIEEM